MNDREFQMFLVAYAITRIGEFLEKIDTSRGYDYSYSNFDRIKEAYEKIIYNMEKLEKS